MKRRRTCCRKPPRFDVFKILLGTQKSPLSLSPFLFSDSTTQHLAQLLHFERSLCRRLGHNTSATSCPNPRPSHWSSGTVQLPILSPICLVNNELPISGACVTIVTYTAGKIAARVWRLCLLAAETKRDVPITTGSSETECGSFLVHWAARVLNGAVCALCALRLVLPPFPARYLDVTGSFWDVEHPGLYWMYEKLAFFSPFRKHLPNLFRRSIWELHSDFDRYVHDHNSKTNATVNSFTRAGDFRRNHISLHWFRYLSSFRAVDYISTLALLNWVSFEP